MLLEFQFNDKKGGRSMKFQKKDLIALALMIILAGTLAVTRIPKDPVITNDGCSYAQTAQNLAEGRGYTYLGKPNVLFPPAYPLLIAAVYVFDKNIESAAMTASVISWMLLIIPAYLIALLLFKSNFIARIMFLGVLVLSPEFNFCAGKVFSETTFILFLYTAIFFFLLFFIKNKQPKIIHCIITGAIFSLSYLARPEGFVVMLFAAGYLLLFRKEKIKTRLIQTAVLVTVFFIVASPYILFLKKHTGSWQLSGRAGITLIGGEQLTQRKHVLHYEKELYGLTPDGKDVYMYSGKAVQMTNYLFKNFGTIVTRIYRNFIDMTTTLWKMFFPIGIFLILAFIVLPPLKEPLKKEIRFLLWMLLPALSVLFFFVYDRYLYAYLPILYFLCILGLLKAGIFLKKKTGIKPAALAAIQVIIILLMQMIVFETYIAASHGEKEKTGSWNEVKELSLWMKDNIHDVQHRKVVARKALVGFYSGAEFAPMPWVENEGELLAYMDRIGAEYLEVDTRYFYEVRPTIYYLIETDRRFERLEVVKITVNKKHKAVLYRLFPFPALQ
jgi:hypothetical protein